MRKAIALLTLTLIVPLPAAAGGGTQPPVGAELAALVEDCRPADAPPRTVGEIAPCISAATIGRTLPEPRATASDAPGCLAPLLDDRCERWVASYDEPAGWNTGFDDRPRDVIVAGGLVIATGYSPHVETGRDAITVAFRADDGSIAWVNRWDGGVGDDQGTRLAVADGRVYVAGFRDFDGSSADALVLAIDAATGEALWDADLGGAGSDYAAGIAARGAEVYATLADSGDVVTAGFDAATGETRWTSTLGTARFEEPTALALSPDGDALLVTALAAEEGEGFATDYLTALYETRGQAGELRWSNRHDVDWFDWPFDAAIGPHGAYVTGIVGGQPGAGGLLANLDFGTISYEVETGGFSWDARHRSSSDGPNGAFAMDLSPDGSRLFVTGQVTGEASGFDLDYGTVAYNAWNGLDFWDARYAVPGATFEFGQDVEAAGDRVYVTGWASAFNAIAESEMATIAYEWTDGAQAWAARNGDPGEPTYGMRIAAGDAVVAVTGTRLRPAGLTDGNTADLGVVAYDLPPPAPGYQAPGETREVSLAPDGSPANLDSFSVEVTPDGRHAMFHSDASNLVPGDTNGERDVYVRDLIEGTLERVSLAHDGSEPDERVVGRSISDDGRFVSAYAWATNLVPGDTNERRDAFVFDRETGAVERVSVASDGTEQNGHASDAVMSGDGRYVVFQTSATNLDAAGTPGVFVHDRQTGETRRVSVSSEGTPNIETSSSPAITPDGRFIAFLSRDPGLVPGDTWGYADIFVHDQETGETERVSVRTDGGQADGNSFAPSISDDGRFVAFHSYANNIAPVNANFETDVFVHDRETGETELVSVSSAGVMGNDRSDHASISGDGRFVAFDSMATTFRPADPIWTQETYLHDRVTGATTVASIDVDGQPVYYSFLPSLSGSRMGFTNGMRSLVRELGPPVGVGGLEARAAGDGTEVEGWARFAGTATEVADAAGDGEDGAHEAGLDLVGAAVAVRPELGDVLVRMELTDLTDAREPVPGEDAEVWSAGAPLPGPAYVASFVAGGTRYEVRATRSDPRSATFEAGFHLFACEAVCEERAALDGGYGTTGDEVRVAIPVGLLGDGDLEAVSVVTGLGTREAGIVQEMDRAEVGEVAVALPRVEVAADGGAWLPADLVQGRFTATLQAASEVRARACLGEVCGERTARIEP